MHRQILGLYDIEGYNISKELYNEFCRLNDV